MVTQLTVELQQKQIEELTGSMQGLQRIAFHTTNTNNARERDIAKNMLRLKGYPTDPNICNEQTRRRHVEHLHQLVSQANQTTTWAMEESHTYGGKLSSFSLITYPNWKMKDTVINYLKKKTNLLPIWDDNGQATGRHVEWSTHQSVLDRIQRYPLQCIAHVAKHKGGFTQEMLHFDFKHNELWTRQFIGLTGEEVWTLQSKVFYNDLIGEAKVIINTELFDYALENWPVLWEYYSGETRRDVFTSSQKEQLDQIKQSTQAQWMPSATGQGTAQVPEQQDAQMKDASQGKEKEVPT